MEEKFVALLLINFSILSDLPMIYEIRRKEEG